MVRVLGEDIERLREEISLVRLVESSGVPLHKRGPDHIGRCPFHEDDAASLVINPDNRWRCPVCEVGGDVIDWVVKRSGVSFDRAVELLRDGSPEGTDAERGQSPTGRRVSSPLDPEADDQALLTQVVGYYHDTLKQSPEALDYLRSRGLVHGELVDRFRLGYANRTLGLRLPEKSRKAGAAIRGRLEAIGLYRSSGHEHFNGGLIVPVFGDAGAVVQVYGRKIRDDLRPGTPLDLFLPGPSRGVWNRDALAASRGEVILAGSLLDAMTFWCGGFRNVTAAYGPDGLTEDLLTAFRSAATKRVLIAFARDEAGEEATSTASERLMAGGFACYRIEFPKGMGANTYTLKVGPAAKSLGLLIRKAAWLGQGRAAAPLMLAGKRYEPQRVAQRIPSSTRRLRQEQPGASLRPGLIPRS